MNAALFAKPLRSDCSSIAGPTISLLPKRLQRLCIKSANEVTESFASTRVPLSLGLPKLVL
jgi:hypothetical protein